MITRATANGLQNVGAGAEPEITQANREEEPSEIQGRTSLVANLARKLVQVLEGGPGS